MPEALTYDPDDKTLRDAADKEYKARQAAHDKAADWYDGVIPNTLAIRPNRTPGGSPINNNVKLNLFAKRVDRRRDFLFKWFPQLDIDDTPGESDAEKWLRDAWEWNRAATLWGLAVQNGAFSGQVYMRVMPVREGRDLYPRAILLSNVITFWQADDVDTPLWYEVRYGVGKISYRQDIVDLSLTSEQRPVWAIRTYQKQGDLGSWEQVAEETIWDYLLGPIVSWQHWPRASRCYGAGEFGDIDLNLAVNRIMSLGNAVIRNHAFPKTILAGAEAGDLVEIAPDELWTLPKDAQVFNLEMQSDLSAILNYIDRLTADYNTQGRTVDVAGGPADFSSITNLAIKVSFMPQEDANEILKRQYGAALVEVSQRLQMLAGQPYEVSPKVIWKAALPESKAETAQVVTTEDQLGIASKETQATQMGLDWQQEQERKRLEGEQGGATVPGQPGQVQPGGVNPFTPAEQAALLKFYQDMKAATPAGGDGAGGGNAGA
jgi:hypothetical protein